MSKKLKFKVYGTATCPYCVQAKKLLEKKKIDHEYLTLEPSSDILQELKEYTKWATVPLVFEVDEKGHETFIGGYTDLNARIRSM